MPRHTEFVYKTARDLERGDILPRGRALAATVDRVIPVTRLWWTTLTVHTQDGKARKMRSGKQVRLVSPTTGPVLVATRARPMSALIGAR